MPSPDNAAIALLAIRLGEIENVVDFLREFAIVDIDSTSRPALTAHTHRRELAAACRIGRETRLHLTLPPPPSTSKEFVRAFQTGSFAAPILGAPFILPQSTTNNVASTFATSNILYDNTTGIFTLQAGQTYRLTASAIGISIVSETPQTFALQWQVASAVQGAAQIFKTNQPFVDYSGAPAQFEFSTTSVVQIQVIVAIETSPATSVVSPTAESMYALVETV